MSTEKIIVGGREVLWIACLFSSVFGLLMLASCNVGYSNDGEEVTWHSWNEGTGHNSCKVDADPKTFEKLDDEYGRDKTHAFFRGGIIDGADGSSFRTLKKSYAADDRHVYSGGDVVENADPLTFKVHSAYLAEDANDYFWNGKALNVRDKKTFKLLGSKSSWTTQWAKDKYNGYFLNGGSIVGIDYATFHPIDARPPLQSGHYAADKHRVFFKCKEIPGADPETFREVDFCVGQDKYRVYKNEKPTQIKDYAALSEIGIVMYTDGIKVYDLDFQVLPDADVSTFEHISDNWYKDKNHVWWSNKLVHGANPSTFRPLTVGSRADFNYGKDENNVYIQDSIIQGADPASFEKKILPGDKSWTIFDRNRVYYGEDSPKLREYLKNKYGE